ncbi:unnamed protein product [Allacma fusca]|uniref:Uncharacterized protein n=1 Tax=Allacma fusca TaxID=39272 RepID=A0A8J2J8H7_9HEXA|nr:unnamed protein product [Allacma fusca]
MSAIFQERKNQISQVSTLELFTVGNIKEETTPPRRFSLKEKLAVDTPSEEGKEEESWSSYECNLGTRTRFWFESWWQWFLQWILPVFDGTDDPGNESSSLSTTIGQSILQVEHRTRKRPCFQRDHHIDSLGVDGMTISEHDMAGRNVNVETAGDSCFTKTQSFSGTSTSADSPCSSVGLSADLGRASRSSSSSRSRRSSRVAQTGGEVVDEGVAVGKPAGIRAKLLSLSVVVVGLIGTVAVPLNVALFFTIVFSSCAIVLLWIFILIQSHGKQLKGSLSIPRNVTSQSYRTLPGQVHVPNCKSGVLGVRSDKREKFCEHVALHLIKTKAESQVEKYLFALWWILSLCDWFSSVIVIYLNNQHHSLNLSLDVVTWCVQIVAAVVAPTVLLSIQSGVLPEVSSSFSSTFLPLIFFIYIIVVRQLGTVLYASCFPYSIVIHLTSLTGLIFGRIVTNFIFRAIHLTSSVNGSADCGDHYCCCSIPQHHSNFRSSDHCSSPINLRRRSSDILNGTDSPAVATGIATPLVKETHSGAQIFAQVTPAAQLSITSISLPKESSFCDPSSGDGRGARKTSDCSKSSSSSIQPYSPLTCTSGQVGEEDLVATEKLTSHGDQIGVEGKAKELPGQGPPLAIKSGSADQLHQHQHQPQDQDHRRALNFFNLSRCHSVVHIVSNQGSEIEKMRRTSLPAALPAQRHAIHHGSTAGVDTAILLEAHGLVTDMLMDHAALPAHIVAGLKALATLLTPPPLPLHYQNPRPRPAPLTLSTDPDYTSDIDEIPYTGEKIWCMPKVLLSHSGILIL